MVTTVTTVRGDLIFKCQPYIVFIEKADLCALYSLLKLVCCVVSNVHTKCSDLQIGEIELTLVGNFCSFGINKATLFLPSAMYLHDELNKVNT